MFTVLRYHADVCDTTEIASEQTAEGNSKMKNSRNTG